MAKKRKEIRVVELFAGVGGFRLGLEGWKNKSSSSHYTETLNSNYKIVWSNQWEPSSKKDGKLQEANLVYQYRWPDTKNSVHFSDDISLVCSPEMKDIVVDKNIPDHDLLVGGFPCQDYSVAGVNSKGIEGKKGVLWWNIHKMISVKLPKYVFLENVDRLLKSPTNQRGRDFAIMLSSLNNIGYAVEWRVINASDYGMPQKRRRVYILAFRKKNNPIKINNQEKWTTCDGIFATAFPLTIKGKPISLELNNNLSEITKHFNSGKFLPAGTMVKGSVWMTEFVPKVSREGLNSYSKKYHVLNDVILDDLKSIPPEFIVNSTQKLVKPLIKKQRPKFVANSGLKILEKDNAVMIETELDKWKYLKGKKAELRASSKGEFYYTEGPLSLVDALNKPSRTIITSEGGAGASRFKHLIRQNNKYRRLLPLELERLNMFPDNHTKLNGISDTKRAFFMGNALVIGIVERIGKELYNKIHEI